MSDSSKIPEAPADVQTFDLIQPIDPKTYECQNGHVRKGEIGVMITWKDGQVEKFCSVCWRVLLANTLREFGATLSEVVS